MKTKKAPISAEIPEGFTVNPALDNKYDGPTPFQEKIDRANRILKVAGLPKPELLNPKAS